MSRVRIYTNTHVHLLTDICQNICVSRDILAHTHTNTHTHTHLFTHTLRQTHSCARARTSTHARTRLHILSLSRVLLHIRTRTRTCTAFTRAHRHAHTHTHKYTHIQIAYWWRATRVSHSNTLSLTYTRHTLNSTRAYLHIYVWFYVWFYVCVYVCVCAYVYAHMWLCSRLTGTVELTTAFSRETSEKMYVQHRLKVCVRLCVWQVRCVYMCVHTDAFNGRTSATVVCVCVYVGHKLAKEAVILEWVKSHVNGSCRIWMSHVTYEWLRSHVNGPCHMWKSHVTYQWVMSHMNEPCNMSMSQWVISHMDEPCHM